MPEFESTSKRGLWCEDFALKKYLKQNYQLVTSNKKWAGVEVDLLFYKRHYLMVEVKAIADFDRLHFRMTTTQLQRLLKSRHWIADHFNEAVEMRILFVKSSSEYIELNVEDLL